MSRRLWLCAALALALLVLGFASLSAGRVWVPWSAWTSAGADPRWAIVFELRLPRTLLALLVGGGLGLCGAALQGYTRNPLADPGVLGVSSVAALGAVLTLYLGVAGEAPWVLPAGAMVGAALGVAALLGLAGATSSVVTFILAGVIVQTVAGAGVACARSRLSGARVTSGAKGDRGPDMPRRAISPAPAPKRLIWFMTGTPDDARPHRRGTGDAASTDNRAWAGTGAARPEWRFRPARRRPAPAGCGSRGRSTVR